jgi:hypothetical protein
MEFHQVGDLSWKEILPLAGYGPATKFVKQFYAVEGEVVSRLDAEGKQSRYEGPYRLSDVKSAAHLMVEKSLAWAREFFQTETLNALELELQPQRTYRLFDLVTSEKCKVIRVKVGESVPVPWQGSSYFGSGGAWGERWGYGDYKKLDTTAFKDNGFAHSGENLFLFNGPSVLYATGGDGINGVRVFFNNLYIAEA